MIRIALLLLLPLLLAGGCRSDAGATGISDERFIDVVVQLRRAAHETRDEPAAYAARRDAILREAGVTEEQLRAYVDVRGRDIDHMAQIWDSINTRLATPETQEQ
jgi:hypothetical protein